MPRLVLVNPKNDRTLYGEYGWQPLSLAYLAGVTPPGWDVRIVDEVLASATDADLDADLIGLTAFTTQAPRAYALAQRARALGVRTVIGGVHATFMPEEAGRYADSVVVGEAEGIWARLIADFERGELAPRYAGESPPMDPPPAIPRRELFVPGAYRYASMQSTRGCPLDCSFCSVTAFNGKTFRMSSADWVVDGLHRIPDPRVLIVDDDFNGFSKSARDRAYEVCRAVAERGPKKRWMTQVTINFGEEDALPRMAAKAGCAAVFIGFESVSKSDLATISKKRYRAGSYFYETVQRVRDAGIAVIGSFILGIDGQELERTVEETLEFMETAEIDAFNPTILTPLPGTRDYRRYVAEGRLIHSDFPNDWVNYNLATPTVRSSRHTEARLFFNYQAWMSFFESEAVLARAERTRGALGEAAAEAAYLWNRAWARHYRRALALPPDLPLPPPPASSPNLRATG